MALLPRWRTSRSGILLACCVACVVRRSAEERRTLILKRFLRSRRRDHSGEWLTGVAPLGVRVAEEALVVAKDPTVRACLPLAEKGASPNMQYIELQA